MWLSQSKTLGKQTAAMFVQPGDIRVCKRLPACIGSKTERNILLFFSPDRIQTGMGGKALLKWRALLR